MRLAIRLWLVLIPFVLSVTLPSSSAAQSKILVLDGKVAVVTPMEGIDVSCGVAAPQLLIKYEIEKLHVGVYDETEIIIDHLACGTTGVRSIKQGDSVVVIAKPVRHVPEEIDSLGLRPKSPYAKRYFLAVSVGKRIFTTK